MNSNYMGTVKNLTASGEIDRYRIAAWDAVEGQVKQASAATDALVGVSAVRGAPAAGDRIDIYLDGVRDIEFGGDVVQGDRLTADAQGRAIKAEPGADITHEIIGRALINASVGVIGQMHIQFGTVTG